MKLVAFMTFLVINFVQVFMNLISMGLNSPPGLHKETKLLGSHCLSGTVKNCEPITQDQFDNREKDFTDIMFCQV